MAEQSKMKKICKIIIPIILLFLTACEEGCNLFPIKDEIISERDAEFLPGVEGGYSNVRINANPIVFEPTEELTGKGEYGEIVYIKKSKFKNEYNLAKTVDDEYADLFTHFLHTFLPLRFYRIKDDIYLLQCTILESKPPFKKAHWVALCQYKGNSLLHLVKRKEFEKNKNIMKAYLKNHNLKRLDGDIVGNRDDIIAFFKSLLRDSKMKAEVETGLRKINTQIAGLELNHFEKSIKIYKGKVFIKKKLSLHLAIENANFKGVQLLINKYPTWLHIKTTNGKTPLQLAERKWNMASRIRGSKSKKPLLDIIRFLISKGANQGQITNFKLRQLLSSPSSILQ